MIEKICAFNTSSETLFLDHISPLASLLKIPLIATDRDNALMTEKFYPEVELRYLPDLEFRLKEIAEEFDGIIECNFWDPRVKLFFESFFQKKMKLIFCPHGQSDKGYRAPSLALYASLDRVLLYGSLMKEMLTDLGLFDSIDQIEEMGNFRWEYYQLHKKRLLDLADSEVLSKFSDSRPLLLYAPTWKDDDASTSFFDYCEHLIKELPPSWNLLIKIHPLIPSRNPEKFYRLAQIAEEKAVLDWEFMPIYPLLERADAYLGDYSSIGYDFLVFEKPMFFFSMPHMPFPRLHSCGQILSIEKPIFQSIEKGMKRGGQFIKQQRDLYRRAFSVQNSWRRAVHRLMQ